MAQTGAKKEATDNRSLSPLYGDLKNPLVIASCGLTTALQGVQNCAKAGAGAAVTQVCSTVYRNGFVQIKTMLDQLRGWMETHNFNSLADSGAASVRARVKIRRATNACSTSRV